MSTATFSFSVSAELANQTRDWACASRLSVSEYIGEAVREKNESALKDRMIFLSKRLSSRHLKEHEAQDDATNDGLART